MTPLLNINKLSELSLAEYLKEFRNKAMWRKATYVLILIDKKLNGKKAVIALPFKKQTEAKEAFKKLKREKIHILAKTALGSFSVNKTPDGEQCIINITKGNAPIELLEQKANKLFAKLKWTLKVAQKQTNEQNQAKENTEQQQQPTDNKTLVAEYAAGAQKLAGKVKDIQNQVKTAIDKNEATEQQIQFVQNVKNDIKAWLKKVQEQNLQSPLAKTVEGLSSAVIYLRKLAQMAQRNLRRKEAQERVRFISQRVSAIKTRIQEIQQTLNNVA